MATMSPTQTFLGRDTERQGLKNLLSMLQQQGRIDPRIMASMQAANARSTQQQQDAARASASRGGFARGGLAQALQGAIGAAGANRAAGITYQDAADAYGRNQQNIGLMGGVVQQPNLGYANLNEQMRQFDKDIKMRKLAAGMSFAGSLLGGGAG